MSLRIEKFEQLDRSIYNDHLLCSFLTRLLIHEYSAIQIESCGIGYSTTLPQSAHAQVQLF